MISYTLNHPFYTLTHLSIEKFFTCGSPFQIKRHQETNDLHSNQEITSNQVTRNNNIKTSNNKDKYFFVSKRELS